MANTQKNTQVYKGHVVDPLNGTMFDGAIYVQDGRILDIEKCEVEADAPYYLPGFVDSHVHIESSMMMPKQFARVARRHGTVGIVCDPHEIANVLGRKGIEMMLEDAKGVDFYFAFCVPSCVPACGGAIETSGEVLDSKAVAELLKRDEIYGLAEMMNYPGVLNEDPEVMAKIAAAKAVGKPIDGHAPGLRGEDRKKYAAAGITTDHECSSYDEALDAIKAGMKVLIRKGSAAVDYPALAPLIKDYPDQLMFCTDDAHPYDLLYGHVDRDVRVALADGYPLMNVLKMACVNPVLHYNLPIGLLRKGDSADFIAISELTSQFQVLASYIHGHRMIDAPLPEFEVKPEHIRCVAKPITPADIQYVAHNPEAIPQIVAADRSLLTQKYIGPLDSHSQKIVVYNRYTEGAKPQTAYIRGFELKNGALAQSIAHDCHNIIAVGTSDELICQVVNRVIENHGGIAATDGVELADSPLPIGGIMSPEPCELIAVRHHRLLTMAEKAGCPFKAPFITLGFMALPVIPELKLTDKGLFDSTVWSMIER